MTRIDFYLLNASEQAQKLDFACRLVEKAWQRGHRIYLHTPGPELSTRVDELLWSFRPASFIPHALADTDPRSTEPVLVGHDDCPPHCNDVLINLADEIPAFFSRFQRVSEIVSADEASRQRSRDNYRFYRDRGYPLHTHQLN